MKPKLDPQIIEELSALNPAQQREVLRYARTLSGTGIGPGVSGRSLLRFLGTIPEAEAALMEAAIKEGCERVERDAR